MFRSIVVSLVTLAYLPWLLLHVEKKQGGPRKVLVIQLGKIGDLVCTTPLFRALHHHGYKVVLLCEKRMADVVKDNPAVSECVLIDQNEYIGIWGRLKLLHHLSYQEYDIAISCMPTGTNSILLLWSRAQERIMTTGGRPSCITFLLRPFISHTIRYTRGTRTFDHYMTLALTTGASIVPYQHEWYIAGEEKDHANRWLHDHGIQKETPFVMFSITAGNNLKEWPVERFVELATHVLKHWNMHVLFSSSDKNKTDKAITISPKDKRIIDAGGLPLRLLAAIIARSRAFVSVDTGPLYIAHALNVPIVDIVGPVDPREQPPPSSKRVECVLSPDCKPSSFVAETLRIPSKEQVQAIDKASVSLVIKALDRLLTRTQ